LATDFRNTSSVGCSTRGFGLTYLAAGHSPQLGCRHQNSCRRFAVRTADTALVPKSEFDADSYSWGLERFKEEARALARLKASHIVRVSRLLEAHGQLTWSWISSRA